MGLHRQERAELRARKNREKRKERRRIKLWHHLQSRSYTDASNWDDKAKTDESIEHYRDKINKECGMYDEDYETGRSTWHKKKCSNAQNFPDQSKME